MNATEIVTLYRFELRSALRDRTIVINSIVLPVVLYPALLWFMFTGISFVRGQTNDMASRVALLGAAALQGEVEAPLREAKQVEMMTAPRNEADAERQVRAGTLDAVLVLDSDATLTNNFRSRLVYDGSRERSETARRRVTDVVGAYRERRLRDEAFARGIDASRWAGFAIERKNTASGRQMGAFLLGLLLPILFVVMVALGCLNPAIDTTAGERERSTWETLMSTGASRSSIVTAKYLAVTTLGGVAGLLNVIAMLLTMRGIIAPLLGSEERIVEFRVPLASVPVLLAGALLLAAFLAAGMMVLAAFARTFREGQSMVTPFYMASIVPTMLLGSPGTQLTLPLALVPVVNIALVVREAIQGRVKPLESAVALASTLVAIALLIRLATYILRVEDVVLGSYSGSLVTFLKQRRRAAGTRS